MAGIVIFNGPFVSGKTVYANALEKISRSSYPGIEIKRIADGTHLVAEIKDIAHGKDGDCISDSHCHPWVERPEGGHHHLGLELNSHFPFTVRVTDVTDAMIRAFLSELSSISQIPNLDLIIAELGTGIPDGKISKVQLTTSRFLEIARKQPFWDSVKKKIIGIVTFDVKWGQRLERDNRPQLADGVNESWSVNVDAMNITREPDFAPWMTEFPPEMIVPIDNNGTMRKDKTDEICLRQLRPVLSIIESNLTL